MIINHLIQFIKMTMIWYRIWSHESLVWRKRYNIFRTMWRTISCWAATPAIAQVVTLADLHRLVARVTAMQPRAVKEEDPSTTITTTHSQVRGKLRTGDWVVVRFGLGRVLRVWMECIALVMMRYIYLILLFLCALVVLGVMQGFMREALSATCCFLRCDLSSSVEWEWPHGCGGQPWHRGRWHERLGRGSYGSNHEPPGSRCGAWGSRWLLPSPLASALSAKQVIFHMCVWQLFISVQEPPVLV